MTELLKRLCFEDLRVLLLKYVQLLFVRCSLHIVLRLSCCELLLLVELGLEGRDFINDADSAWAVYSSRNALLPYLLIIFLELVQVFELTFEFSCYQKMLCLLVDSEHIIVLIMELLEFDLVET